MLICALSPGLLQLLAVLREAGRSAHLLNEVAREVSRMEWGGDNDLRVLQVLLEDAVGPLLVVGHCEGG